MATKKFTDFPAVVTPLASDLIWAVQAGADVKETLGQVLSLALSTNSLSYAGNPNGNLAGTIYQTCYDTTNAKYYICTTTGSAATAVWTLIGANIVGLNQGGTNKALTANNGGIVYSDADSLEILAATTTANKVLMSGASSAPHWSTPTYPTASGTVGQIIRSDGTNNLYTTATYPNTTTINQILYSSSANVIAGLATANSAQLVTNATGVPAMTASLTNGQVIIGSTGATPTPSTLTAGTGVSVVNGAGSITINAIPVGLPYTEVTGVSASMAVNNGYISNNAARVSLLLPATAAIGDKVEVIGKGAGGWRVTQAAGQQINIGQNASTVGVTGYVQSQANFNSVVLICTIANTTWTNLGGAQGNLTVN